MLHSIEPAPISPRLPPVDELYDVLLERQPSLGSLIVGDQSHWEQMPDILKPLVAIPNDHFQPDCQREQSVRIGWQKRQAPFGQAARILITTTLRPGQESDLYAFEGEATSLSSGVIYEIAPPGHLGTLSSRRDTAVTLSRSSFFHTQGRPPETMALPGREGAIADWAKLAMLETTTMPEDVNPPAEAIGLLELLGAMEEIYRPTTRASLCFRQSPRDGQSISRRRYRQFHHEK